MGSRRLKLCGELLRGNVGRYLGSVGAMVVSVGVSFATPLVLAEAIDAIIGRKRALSLPGWLNAWVERAGGVDFLVEHLWIPALLLLALNLMGGAFQYLRGRWSAQASESIAKRIRDRLYDHLQRLPYDYHVKAETGDLIQRCTSDVETIRRFLSSQLVEIFRTLFMVTIALSIMLRMNVRMTLISMVLVPPLFLCALKFFQWVRKAFRDADNAEGRMSAVLQENLSGVRVVRAFGRQAYEVEKFARVNDDLHEKSKRLSDLLAIYWPATDCLGMTQVGITLIYGVFLAARGDMLVGEMTVFVSYISMLVWPIRQLGRILSDFGKSLVSLDRIDEILCLREEPEEPDALTPPLDRDIEFRHVGFEYRKGSPVLRDVSFTVKRGQTVAILGGTGSGKSTLMALLQRLYEPTSGQILIGGVDICKIRKSHLRARVGLILQEPFLYSRSVRDNLSIARTDAPWPDVERAAQDACAREFIEGFDRGYETPVGERGVTLSGGQKQRMAIARTLLRENDVLIFDDSLSAVDTQTDAAIRRALSDRSRDTTTFIISHRLTTLSEADLIVVLEDGRVTQQGTHEQLTHQPGLYRDVWRIQSALEEELSQDAG